MAADLSLLSTSSIATETIPTTWIGSPRISFSQDLRQQDEEDGGEKRERMDEFSDFDFCVTGDGCAHESSTADQLFSDGMILPIPIQTQERRPTTIWVPPTTTIWVPPTTTAVTLDKGRKKTTVTADDEEHDKSTKTAFWKFGRSSSLNCGGSGSRGGGGNMSNILCSSLTLLSRSKSTGSNLNSSTMQKQQQQRKNNGHKSSSSSRGKLPKMNYGASSSSYYYASCHGYYGNNGVRISPVLNVPYMPKGSGGANGFFGFGHLLCSGKNSRKKNMLTPATQPS